MLNIVPQPNRMVVEWDSFNDPYAKEPFMYFRLTYEGPLHATQDVQGDPDKRRFQKHDLRRKFHPQLKHLWETHPMLIEKNSGRDGHAVRYIARTAAENQVYGYSYVPLLKKGDHVICHIETLFLRRQMPGGLIRGGDLDNRMKSLYDGLRMPSRPAEMRDIAGPQADETPFFVLLEEDNLITHTAIETDILLDPPEDPGSDADMARVRLILTVGIKACRD
ncbi:hypothetical protein [Mesorhizobium carmichaelinearum]|uniref:hypothetical protein n=1 Tax=Mesorhizobium carmichaelinearum TaxID=1208188 RepID=UPI00117EC9A1|nr:hypothetical protein [Mesorhizobium carmichaelinearum]